MALSPYPTGSFQGYPCGICQTYIPVGSFHQCGGTPQPPVTVKSDRQQEIIDRLDRIIGLLELKQ